MFHIIPDLRISTYLEFGQFSSRALILFYNKIVCKDNKIKNDNVPLQNPTIERESPKFKQISSH